MDPLRIVVLKLI